MCMVEARLVIKYVSMYRMRVIYHNSIILVSYYDSFNHFNVWFLSFYYYPPEVSSMNYCCLGVFRKEYFRLATK